MSTTDNDQTSQHGFEDDEPAHRGGKHMAPAEKGSQQGGRSHGWNSSHGNDGNESGHGVSRSSNRRDKQHPVAHHVRGWLTAAAIVAALVVGLAIGNGGLVAQGASHVDSTTIKNSFADVAELATQEYDFTNVGKFSQDDMKILDLSIPFTGRSFLITYSGEVKAGIEDISKATVTVDDASRTVNVTLPQVTVLDSHIDTNTVQTYDQTLNPISQISVDDVTSFLASEENTRRDEAINGGILDKARTRAEDLITNNIRALLSNTAEKDYQINITWQEDSQDSASGSDAADGTSSADISQNGTQTSASDTTSGDESSAADTDTSGNTSDAADSSADSGVTSSSDSN